LTSDPSAAVKWPKVPACYGWLSLDRRGCWRLKGEVIHHAGLIGFINSHYGADDSGNWIFQNGPQAVFVALDYTPLVLRMESDGGFTAHTGATAGSVTATYLDEEGSVLLDTALGIGLLDDRDIPDFISSCQSASGELTVEDALLATMKGGPGVFWRGMPLQAIRRSDVPMRFRFFPTPVATSGF
jgi:hypothetical protein